ncbi:hypothetical protein [Clostridium butyricum]
MKHWIEIGLEVLYEINGKVYALIGGGRTSAGTNMMQTNYADSILEDIWDIEEDIKNRDLEIIKKLRNRNNLKIIIKNCNSNYNYR